ncbi:MAG TPA: cyclic nucleotide-binding domain-containing protein [Burkholderiaceae bacterium]|nr:cyclic nucleotide-binding domain-containing protein [Burkholderiaceae bacterium]
MVVAHDIQALYEAVHSLNAEDAFKPRLTLEQWRLLQQFLTRHEVRAGDLLLKQGEREHTMYLLESGTLQVFVDSARPGAARLSILRPGAVVGEAGMFSDQPRMANVEAMTPCVVWALRGPRIEEMAARNPALALEVVRACAAVMGVRMRANIEHGHAFS